MEQILHYVWKHRLFPEKLETTDGKSIEVIDTGSLNTDEGPDFFNAKIKIDGQVWVGNIEIHTSSSDWYKHKHEKNKSYNTVILHVVENADKEVKNELNQIIPQCRISYPKHIKDNIEFLLHSNVAIPCCNYISMFPKIHMDGWLNVLLLERLERKANDIYLLLEKFNNSWEEVLYVLLCRNFGFGLNSESFERLALSLPLRYIQKHADNVHQIEALLFGQAGLLEEEQPDEYSLSLQQEYTFLKNKFELQNLNPYIFKKMRIRPIGSPFIRIGQLASLLHERQHLFSQIIKCEDVGRLRLLFHANASEYWQTHYSFGMEAPRKNKYLGNASLDVIIINTVVPLLFTYGKKAGDETLCERALQFLETIKAETNFITRDFANCGIKIKTAYDSQALIQLKREYCETRKCLYCRIGYKMLSEK